MNQQRLIAASAVIVSILLAFIPHFVPICAKTTAMGQPMRCFYTYRTELIVGLLAVITSASLFVLTERQGKILAGIILTLLAITSVVLPRPWLSGICMHPGAACHNTYFWTMVGGVILGSLGLFTFWSNFKPSKSENEQYVKFST